MTKLRSEDVIWPWEWRDAEQRLRLMEERAARALRDPSYRPAIHVVMGQDPEPANLFLPDDFQSTIVQVPASGLLLGPDGQPIGGRP